jgi:glycosyltransferase involved in cell wall biosynthesis
MRVLHLADRLSDRGGADWHLRGVIEAQVATGLAVQLAVGRGEDTPPCPLTEVPGVGARTREPAELGPLLDRVQPDLIHLHNVVNPAVLEWAAQQALPALVTVQDHRCFCPGRGKWTAAGDLCREPMDRTRCASCFSDPGYFDAIYRLTEERLAAMRQLTVTVLSHYMKRELVRVGMPEERILVIPPFVHGLDPEAPAAGPPCVLFVGRLVDAKGPADAVEVWRRMGLDLPLALAGTGSARDRLEGIEGVKLLGWVPHARLAGIYRRARVVLMPCRWQEPFGIVGLEALTLGVPVAAWDSGGVAEWHAAAGQVPWGDVDGLARAARGLVGARAAAPAGFEREPLMRQLHDLYARLLATERR